MLRILMLLLLRTIAAASRRLLLLLLPVLADRARYYCRYCRLLLVCPTCTHAAAATVTYR